MGIWGTLLATAAGAAIALLGQHLVKRAETKTRMAELALEQCALIAASAEDFHNRVWEERALGHADRVSGWDLSAHRLASARLQILTTDQRLLTALAEVNESGQQLGSYWRRHGTDDAEYRARWERHRNAMAGFLSASGESLRRKLIS